MPPNESEGVAEVTRQFNSTAEALPLACILVNAASSQVLAGNARALRLLPDGIVGREIVELAANPQQLSQTLSQFSRSRSAVPGRWKLQSASPAEDGVSLNLRVTGALYEGANANDEKTVLVTLDNQTTDNKGPFAELTAKHAEVQRERHMLLRDNKLLEAEVTKRTNALELRNEELDLLNQSLNDFVSIVSHDLAGPTRRIQSFATLLDRELPADIKDGNIADFLRYLVESAQRLTQMIDGSVRLSRIRPSTDDWARINTGDVVEHIVADLQALHPTVDFVVNHTSLHQPYADPGLVDQLFQNLINNAIKFRRPEVPLVVDISSSENAELDYMEFTVKDNGSGISENDLKRVMRPFSRGSDVESISGTGLGMAMCSRICQQHQGRFWIESSSIGENGESAGTEIRFRLPASPVVEAT